MPVHSPRLFGDIQLTQVGVGGIHFSGEKRYEGVRFNVISVMRGGWGSNSRKEALRIT